MSNPDPKIEQKRKQILDELSAELQLFRNASCPDRHNHCPASAKEKNNKACAYLAKSDQNDRAAIRNQCLALKDSRYKGIIEQIKWTKSSLFDMREEMLRDMPERARGPRIVI